jgi:uncharacterized protein YecE (DUF72 family)
MECWAAATPPGFLFSVKAHQRITHILRLKDAAQFSEAFFNSVAPLKNAGRLGPVLFQLPPQFRCDVERLAAFVEELPPQLRFAIEFRNESWFCDPAYRVLEKHNIALCLAESEKLEVPKVITSDFVYFRLRKKDYSAEERSAISGKVQEMLGSGRDVFVYFKHEETPAGALYAEELLKQGGGA